MGDPEPEPTDLRTGLGGHTAGPRSARALPLACILAVAAGLRFWNPDVPSLWYDEVVTMRLTRMQACSRSAR